MDETKGVIVDLDQAPKKDSPTVANLKKHARKIILGGLGLAATTTGVGLSLDAHQNSHRTDTYSKKPIPTLVKALPTPTASPDQSHTPPKVLTYAELDALAEKETPRLNFADYLELSKDEQEKAIRSLEGKSVFLNVDVELLKLRYKSDDKFGNKSLELVLDDAQKRNGYPIEITVSPSAYESLKEMWENNKSGISVPEGTRFFVQISKPYDNPTDPPHISLLQKPAQK